MRRLLALGLIALPIVAAAGGCGGDGSAPAKAETNHRGVPVWRALPRAQLSRTEVGAARIGRSIYVVGGYLASGATTAAGERFDLRRNRWRRIKRMPIAVNHPAVTTLDGRLYVYGGFTDNPSPETNALQVFNPATKRWRLLPPSHHRRAAAALVSAGGRLYAIGGVRAGQPLAAFETYDPARRRWRTLPGMAVPREHLAATVADGRLYVLGGRARGANLDVAERFSFGRRRWTRIAPLSVARSGFAAVTVSGRVIAFGGEELTPGGETIRAVEAFDPAAGRWQRLPGMRTPRHGLGGVADGRAVYAVEGGPSPGLTVSNVIEVLRLPR